MSLEEVNYEREFGLQLIAIQEATGSGQGFILLINFSFNYKIIFMTYILSYLDNIIINKKYLITLYFI